MQVSTNHPHATAQPSQYPCDQELLYRAVDALDELLRDPVADKDNSDGYARCDIERFDRTRQLIRERLRGQNDSGQPSDTQAQQIKWYQREIAKKNNQIRRLMRAVRMTGVALDRIRLSMTLH